MAWYLDTSAAVKLVVAEEESPALTAWLQSQSEPIVSSDLLRTELLRAAQRQGGAVMLRARIVLEAVTIFSVPTDVFDRAGDLHPAGLRSLDAIHLASALELGDDLSGIVAYDARLAAAAAAHGLTVVAPRPNPPG